MSCERNVWSRSALGGGGVDDGLDGADRIGGESGVGGVATDQVFAWGDVDADDLVGRDVGVDPLNLGTEVSKDGAGGLRGCYELIGGEISDVGHVALRMRNFGT